MNFREDIEIDEMNLEDELVKQSTLLFDYEEALNSEKEILSKLNLDLELSVAKTAHSIRSGNYETGLSKLTEGIVGELINKDSELVEKREAIIAQKRVVDTHASAVNAIQSRKSMLQKLVDLWIYGYYNNVNPSGSAPKAGSPRQTVTQDDLVQIRGINAG